MQEKKSELHRKQRERKKGPAGQDTGTKQADMPRARKEAGRRGETRGGVGGHRGEAGLQGLEGEDF